MASYDRSPPHIGQTRTELALQVRDEQPRAYLLADVGAPLLLAALWLIVPFDASTAARVFGAVIIALVGPLDYILRRRLPGAWSNYGLLLFRQAVGLGLAASVAVMWYPVALIIVATAVGAFYVESIRRIIVMTVTGVAGLIIIALIHGISAWFLSIITLVILVASHMTWFQEWGAERAEVDRRYDEMVDRARMFSWEIDERTGEIVNMAGNVEAVLGYTARELIGSNVNRIVDVKKASRRKPENDDDEVVAVVHATHRNGSIVTLREVRLASLREGRVRGVSVDITELAAATDALRYQAEHDALTGLVNRMVVESAVTETLAAPDAPPLTLIMADLDRFKEINDTLGHPTGDRVLRVLADRMASQLPELDVVARIGGDEFAFVASGSHIDADAALVIGERVHALATAPVEVDGLRLAVACSVGVALSPGHGVTYSDLLKHADIATYDAKRARGGVALFESTPDELTVRRLRLISDAASGLDNGEFELHMQPQVDLATGAVLAVEGLARWRHPELGLLAPGEFFHAVEVSADYHRFTNEMIRQAIEFAAAAEHVGHPVGVAVNLGSMSFLDQGLPGTLKSLLTHHGVDPGRLTLEVVESDLLDEHGADVPVFTALGELGVRLSIDDFGTGYSTFTRLRTLHVDEVKIDRGFVRGLTGSEEDRVIVRSTVQIGQLLGLDIVAEGVETPEQLQWLQRFGCRSAQGYLWSAAIHPTDMLASLERGRRFDVGERTPGRWNLDVSLAKPLLESAEAPEVSSAISRLFHEVEAEAGPVGIIAKDLAGRIVDGNCYFRASVGELFPAMVGMRDEDFALGADGTSFGGDGFSLSHFRHDAPPEEFAALRIGEQTWRLRSERSRLHDADGHIIGDLFLLRTDH